MPSRSGRPSFAAARVRACTAVACDSPLIHGGRPPRSGTCTPTRSRPIARPRAAAARSSAAPRARSTGSLLREQRVRLAPRAVHLQLQPEPAVVLEHELAAGERDPRRPARAAAACTDARGRRSRPATRRGGPFDAHHSALRSSVRNTAGSRRRGRRAWRSAPAIVERRRPSRAGARRLPARTAARGRGPAVSAPGARGARRRPRPAGAPETGSGARPPRGPRRSRQEGGEEGRASASASSDNARSRPGRFVPLRPLRRLCSSDRRPARCAGCRPAGSRVPAPWT